MKYSARSRPRGAQVANAHDWVLIPVKPFSEAKSRLASHISECGRELLALRMLQHTLQQALHTKSIHGVAVVSRSLEVRSLCESLGARFIQENGFELNQALEQGAQEIWALGAKRILILPADIPAVQVKDLEQLMEARPDHHEIIICPDSEGLGTNALLIPHLAKIPFRFGAHSFQRHREEAKRLGITCRELSVPNIAIDVDYYEDLVGLQGHKTSDRLRALISKLTNARPNAAQDSIRVLSA